MKSILLASSCVQQTMIATRVIAVGAIWGSVQYSWTAPSYLKPSLLFDSPQNLMFDDKVYL